MRLFLNYRPGAVEDLALGRIRSLLLTLRPDLEIESSATLERDPARVRITPQTCDVMLVLIDRDWGRAMTDPRSRPVAVESEISAALNRIIPVIPLVLEGAQMPSPVDLPGPLQGLALREAMDMRSETLAIGLTRLLPLLPAARSGAQPQTDPSAPRRSPLHLLLALGGLVIVAAIGLLVLQSRL